jgi:hypothetical protein
MDSISVYYAYDILSDLDEKVTAQFWQRLKVSYGDAEYTLIKGKDAYRLIADICKELSVEGKLPEGLLLQDVFFAIDG